MVSALPPRFGLISLLVAVLLLLPPHAQPTVTCPNDYKLPVTVLEHSDFYISIIDSESSSVSCCNLTRKDRTYKLNAQLPILTDANEVVEVVSSKNQCAVRVRGATIDSAGDWCIRNCAGTNRKVVVTVLPFTSRDETADQLCLSGNSTTDGDCMLYNLDTEDQRSCGANVTDWAKYKCVYRMNGTMAFQEKVYPVAPLSIRQSEPAAWTPAKVSEVYQNYVLECKMPDEELTTCHVEHLTSRRSFNISDGLQLDDYSAFKTQLQYGVCQFEIPTEDNGEARNVDMGKWRMTIKYGGKNKVCQFLVGSTREKTDSMDDQEMPITYAVNGTTINCAEEEVGEVNTCYARTPSGEIQRPRNPCEFLLNETGTWLCGYSVVDGEGVYRQVEQKFEVHSSEAINGSWDTQNGVMSCKHMKSSPLMACLFLSPTNRPYSGPENVEEWKNGGCEIKTAADWKEEAGWRCVIQTRDGKVHQTPVEIAQELEDFSD